MAVRAQFRGMPWPPPPNTNLREVEVATAATGSGIPPRAVMPLSLMGLGAVLLIASIYVFPAQEEVPTPLPSGMVSPLPMPSGMALASPGATAPPVARPNPRASIRHGDLATPRPYGYDRIPETNRAQILAWGIAKGKTDPFLTALPPPVVRVAPTPPPAPAAPVISLPPPVARPKPVVSIPQVIVKPTGRPTPAPVMPLVLSPDVVSLQGVLTAGDSEAMAILNVNGELQTFRVGDMIVANGTRLWLQSIDESRLTVTLKDATGRKVVLSANTG